MNKIKNLFKKDKDGEYESHGSDNTGKYSQQQSSANTGAQSQSAYGSPAQQVPQTQQTSRAPTGGSAQPASGVLLNTNYGDITIALFADKTPKTCKNFAGLADAGKYDGVVFHRIIRDFMIQGGDPTGTGRGGESIFGGNFEDEFDSSLVHSGKGILSMANSGPRTNGSQFFITLAPTPHLNGKHTVFGQVVDGMDIVDRIGSVRVDAQDRPLETIKIVKAQSFTV